jgi:hypothetical protein
MDSVEVFGRPVATLVLALVLLLLAAGFLVSGVRGLRGRDVWVPDASGDPHASARPDFGTTERGRAARWAGLAFLAFGLALVGTAVRLLWR